MSTLDVPEDKRRQLDEMNAKLRDEVTDHLHAESEIRVLNRELEMLVEEHTTELERVGHKLTATLRELDRSATSVGELGENSFQHIANCIPQLAWIADKDGSIYWYNQRWYEYTGTTFEDVKGSPWERVLDKKHLAQAVERWKQSISTGQTFEMAIRLRRADGCYRTFMTHAMPIRDSEERISRWIGTNIDVEDTKTAEERCRLLYGSGLMGIYDWKADGTICDCNDKFLEIVGYTRQDLCAGKINWLRMTPEEYAFQDQCMLSELQAAGIVKAVEKELFRKDGSRVHVELGAATSEGSLSEGVAFALDITDRKKAEAQLASLNDTLAKSEAYLFAVINAATDIAIVVTDASGIIRVFNPGAERMLLYRADEVVGKKTPILFHSESECRVQSDLLIRELGPPPDGSDLLSEPARRDSPAEREWRCVRKDCSTVWVHLSTCAIRDQEGEVVGFIKVATDITARKELERELRDYNLLLEKRVEERTEKLQSALAEKTVLLKEVHHRVKNNLAVVAGLLGMQADACTNDDAIRPLLDSQRRVHSMALIHEHLYGTRNLSRVIFDQYTKILVDQLYTAFAAPERIKITLHAEPIELPVDTAIPCGLILNEILSNSFKYAFPDRRAGEINVSFVRSPGDFLTLTVDDNGVGFQKDVDWSLGETLGLRIIQILSKQLGATLILRNDSGTHFQLTLPMNQAVDSQPETAAFTRHS